MFSLRRPHGPETSPSLAHFTEASPPKRQVFGSVATPLHPRPPPALLFPTGVRGPYLLCESGSFQGFFRRDFSDSGARCR